jgi:two-component system chemotaxis sensor kinase CheA
MISLTARQQRGQILIQIRDDGRGIDCDAIRRKALQQGLKRPDELQRMSPSQLYEMILLSGFSTTGRVTDLSGRGVGMDVVKTNLDQIGGTLEIDSQPGEGTVFTLRLPLTLAIVPCLLLRSGAEQYAVPQRDIEEIVLLDPQAGPARLEAGDGGEVLRRRERLLRVIRLDEMLLAHQRPAGLRQAARGERRLYVVVLKLGSQNYGLVVDDVLESVSLVVKPLHTLLRPLGIYAAATILADGSVALILSAEGLARHGGVTVRPAEAQPALPARTEAGPEAQALLLFRCGPAELLALPLAAVQRVVRVEARRIECVGLRELIDVDGQAVNVLRIERFLGLSPCPDRDALFLILPRHAPVPVGLLASEIVDTPTLALQLDEQACKADGILGCAMIRDQIAVFIDPYRLVEMWGRVQGEGRGELRGPSVRRILVVEDTQFFRHLITSYLQAAGYEVVAATNGREGLDRLAAEKFDLIVSDVEMPVMDGLSFARQVRDDARFEGLPLLALTSLDSAADRDRIMAAGFDAHEVKLDRQRFLAAASGLLARGRAIADPHGVPAHG